MSIVIKNALLVLLKVAAAIQLTNSMTQSMDNIDKIIVKNLREINCKFRRQQYIRYFSVSTELFSFIIMHCKNLPCALAS
jgi:hypothetical protein